MPRKSKKDSDIEELKDEDKENKKDIKEKKKRAKKDSKDKDKEKEKSICYSSLELDENNEKKIEKSPNKEWFAAFDPGKVNFAFIIEEIDTDLLKKLKCPSKKDRFFYKNQEEEKDKKEEKKKKRKKREDYEPTEDYTSFLEEFYHCGKTILCSNNDITSNTDKKGKGSKSLDSSLFLRLTALLDSYKEYFDKCSTIIIEQQMSFGSRINTMAIKIAQHTYSYFLFRYGNEKNIIEFPSYNKTQILGAPAGLEKPRRKKWAIEKADEIWTLRGDLDTSSFVGTKKKKDDMSDCLLHVLSYIICNYYG